MESWITSIIGGCHLLAFTSGFQTHFLWYLATKKFSLFFCHHMHNESIFSLNIWFHFLLCKDITDCIKIKPGVLLSKLEFMKRQIYVCIIIWTSMISSVLFLHDESWSCLEDTLICMGIDLECLKKSIAN